MTYSELAKELELLATAGEWGMIRSWFGYTDDEDERISKCLLWGRFFLTEYFRDKTPEFHRELIRQNLSTENEYCAAPRGFSKTTLNQLCINFEIANQTQKFIVIIEKSFNEASEVIKGVAKVWRDNEMVKQVYGNLIKINQDGTYDDKSSDSQGDVVINGVRLRAKGFNTPIRGLKSNEWRPTKIYVDDVESDEHINNEEQRKKYRENYSQGIVPAVDIEGSIKVRGTILHNDSLLKNLIDQFNGTIYKAFDKNNPETTLLWPERWSYEILMKKKAEMEMEGKGTSKFYQEFLNEAVDDETRTFRWEWLQQEFIEQDLKFRSLARFAAIDVADSLKDGADYTAEIIVDWDSENNWFIQRAKRHKVNVTGLVDLIFQIWQIQKPIKIGVEKKAFNDQIKPLLRLRSEETGVFPVVVELEPKGRNKEDRIRGALVGRFESKKIWFKKDAKDDTGNLKSELYDFPHAKNDDENDALAYIQELGYRPMGSRKDIPNTIENEFWAHKRGQVTNLSQSLKNL